MRPFRLLISCLLVTLSSGALAQQPALDALCSMRCNDWLLQNGKKFDAPDFQEQAAACRQKQREMVRSGRCGSSVQAASLCKKELDERAIRVGSQKYNEAMQSCMAREAANVGTSTAVTDPKPFGRGKVQAYLNALYHDDLNTLRAIDGDYAARLKRVNQITQGIEVSVLNAVVRNYLIHYPIAFKDCLAADSPKVTIGGVWERVTRRGGVETSSEIIDTRRDVPIARHLYPLAIRLSPSSGSTSMEERILDQGNHLEDLRGSHISEVVATTMNGLKCSDPVVQQLERGLLKYAPVLMPKRFGGMK